MTFGLSTAQIAAATKRILDGDIPAPKYPAARVLVNGTEVALRAVGEVLGIKVAWDGTSKTAVITVA